MNSLLGFFTVLLLVYVVPGPDFAVILRHAIRAGAAGRAAAFGVLSGVCVHIGAALLGLSALLTRSAEAFTVVKLAGAAYLLVLGGTSLFAGLRRRAPAESDSGSATDTGTDTGADPPTGQRPVGAGGTPLRRAYAQGFLSNVLNPKAVLFFASLLPQFIDSSSPIVGQILFYGSATVVFGLVYWSIVVIAAERIRGVLGRPTVRRWLDSVTGIALIGFGVRVARSQAP